ncbi:MAG: DUF159 family protein [Rhodobacterales bacterium]|nr:MAG: DUF159 family protein [Rhodobacterales bacterium]
MCNLYSSTTSQEAMRQLFAGLDDRTGNLEPREQIYPDQMAPVIRNDGAGQVLQLARWGLPTPEYFMRGRNYDKGVTNVRNTGSRHWQRWLGPEHRCLVPVTSFAEPVKGGNQWFEVPEPAFFAGLFVPDWTSTRKVKDGETTDDLFAFLTTEPNEEVAPIHPKAMPVILTDADEWTAWLSASWADAAALQRPLADGILNLIP